MKLLAWLAFVFGLFTALVALARLLPVANRGLGFLLAAIVFYAVTLTVPVILVDLQERKRR